jgi:hypothetical protein
MPHAHRPITRPPPRPLSLSIPSLEIYEDATSTPAPAGPGLQYPSLEPWPSITGAEGGGGGMGRTGAEGTAGLRMLGTAGPDPFVMPSSANGGHGRPPRATHSTPVADPLIGPTGKNGNREAADAAPETTPPNATPARIWTTALTRILSSDAGFVAKHFPAHAAVPFGSGGTVNAALMAAMAGSVDGGVTGGVRVERRDAGVPGRRAARRHPPPALQPRPRSPLAAAGRPTPRPNAAPLQDAPATRPPPRSPGTKNPREPQRISCSRPTPSPSRTWRRNSSTRCIGEVWPNKRRRTRRRGGD